MSVGTWLGLACAVLLGFCWQDSVPGAEAAKPKQVDPKDAATKFLRVLRDDKKRPVAMQTAIVRYERPQLAGAEKPADPLYVDLIGAVHVGDTSYYEQLNKEFDNYDVLLYELVAPKDKAVPKAGKRSAHPIGMMQQGMTGVLDLDYQLDRIDYKKKNFVHADMSPDDFSKSMADRNESMLTMMFRMMGYGIAQQSRHPERNFEAQLIAAFFDRNQALALKRVMAQQFEDLEGPMGMLDGPTGSTIITERNKVAFEVLAREIKAGKKHLGVFYGAGHLPDMEKRLANDFGLKPIETRWMDAWDLSGAKPAAKAPAAEAPRRKAG